MCGIAGYVGTATIDRQVLDRCLRVMHHRGPDASGSYEHVTANGRRIYLLSTRLSIIDLDARANQPMRFGSHVMVFNGELYNYRELRRHHGWTNGQLRTESDTEVLLRVLARDGWAGLDRCEGMWSVALFDEGDGSLLLARDRFGEKPLYLYQAADGLYFGSEIKFIVALLGRGLKINYDHLYRYLVNGYKALYKNGAAFFDGLRELPASCALLIGADGTARERRYWHPSHERDEGLTYVESVARVREHMIRAVELRLRADVPLSLLLSGGVDSNTLLSIACNVFGHDLHAFTIVNDDPRYDERIVVEDAVAALDIRHTPIRLEREGFLDRLRLLVRRHDAPIYTISYYAHWLLLQQIAAHGYRISISGTGADELFSGYYDHYNAYLRDVHADPAIFGPALRAWRRRIRPLVRNPHLIDPEVFIRSPGFRDHIFLDADVFAGYLRRPWHEAFAEEQFCDELLRNRMLNEMFHEAVPAMLHEDDHNAMSVSVENRSPFLDRRLFELCQLIPTRYLIRDGFAKAVLRDAMRGIVPERILNERRKVGFNVPIESFLDLGDRQVRECLMDESPIFEHVKRDAIETLLDQRDLPNSRSKFLFNFINSKIFLEEFGG